MAERVTTLIPFKVDIVYENRFVFHAGGGHFVLKMRASCCLVNKAVLSHVSLVDVSCSIVRKVFFYEQIPFLLRKWIF